MGKTDKKSPEKKASYIVKENHLRGVYIENLSEIVCESAEEAYNLLIQGLSRKKMFATVKNQCSSRSHTVFMFKLFTRQALPDKNDKGSFLGGAQFQQQTKQGQQKLVSRFSLVDLAGSERITEAEKVKDRI